MYHFFMLALYNLYFVQISRKCSSFLCVSTVYVPLQLFMHMRSIVIPNHLKFLFFFLVYSVNIELSFLSPLG